MLIGRLGGKRANREELGQASWDLPLNQLTSQGFALISLRDMEARSQEPEARMARA